MLSTEASSASDTRGRLPMVGDFGTNELTIESLVISGGSVGDDVFGPGDEIRVRFSGETNMAYIPAQVVFGKPVINAILTCETASTYETATAAFQAQVCGELGIDGSRAAQKAMMGRYLLQSQTFDGRALYRHDSGNYFLYSFCNETKRSDIECPRWYLGTSIGSISAGLYSEGGSDLALDPLGSVLNWLGYNGSGWSVESGITVACLDGGVSWSVTSTPSPTDAGEAETVTYPCDWLGSEYSAKWDGRRDLVVTVQDAGGLVGYYDSALADTCSSLPECAVVSETAPKIGKMSVHVREEGWVRHFPQTSSRASLVPPGPVVASPALSGTYGELIPVITRLQATAGDSGADSVYSPGDMIRVVFSVATDMAGQGSCDANADLSNADRSLRVCCTKDDCTAPELTKSDLDALIDFSAAMGANYSGRWRFNATVLEITMLDTTGAAPPGVGHLQVSAVTTRGRVIRTADSLSSGSRSTSPLLDGDFGRAVINITALIGSDPASTSSTYQNGDRISVFFSETTNKGELADSGVTKAEIDGLFDFSVPLGQV